MAGGEQDDPFLWDMERLVQELCSSDRMSALTSGRKLPDLKTLETKIRDQELDGQTLLTYEDLLDIKDLLIDLGITKPPHKAFISEAIRRLKKRSPKYDEWKAGLLDESAPGPFVSSDNQPARLSSEVLASTSASNALDQDPVAASYCPPKELAPTYPDGRIDLPVTPSKVTLGRESILDDTGFDTAPLNAVPAKKRKIAPLIVSSTTTKQNPAFVPTQADLLAYHRQDKVEQVAAFSGYLGDALNVDSILQPPMDDDSEVDDRQFQWVRSSSIPAGRSIQIAKMMNRFLRNGTLATSFVNADSEEELPAFGDSDDEDLVNWEDENQEGLEREEPRKSSRLTHDEIEAIIENAIQSTRNDWIEYKKPHKDHAAWGLWQKARRQYNFTAQINHKERFLRDLEKRIVTLREEILKSEWSRNEQSEKTISDFFANTIAEQMETKWHINLLRNPREPPRSSSLPKPKRRPKRKPDDLDEDEEILTDDDFVVQDDEYEDGHRMDVNARYLRNDNFPETNGLESTALFPEPMEVEARPHSPEPTEVEATLPPTEPMEVEATPPSPEPMEVDLPETPRRPKVKSEKRVLSTPRKSLRSPEILEIQSSPVEVPDKVPDLEDIERIGEIGMEAWARAKDGERLVIAILFHHPPAWRSGIFKLVSEYDEPTRIWDEYIPSSTNINGVQIPPDHMGLQLAGFNLAKLFDAYFSKTACRIANLRLKSTTLQRIRRSEPFFHDFCMFVRRIMPKFLPTTPHTQTPTPRAPSLSPNVSPEAKEDTGEDPDAVCPPLEVAEAILEPDDPTEEFAMDLDALSDSSSDNDTSQSRRKKVRRDEKANDLRVTTMRQTEEFEKRRKLLRHRLAQAGLVPYDKSRLIVNETKESDDQALIYINESIGSKIKDHQVEGVRFMWNQIVVPSKVRSGGLLAHSMGLGKTMQVITLLVVIAEAARSSDPSVKSQIPEDLRESKTIVICPPGLAENWVDELLSWAPKDLLGELFMVDSTLNDQDRGEMIRRWASNGGVMVIGFSLFASNVQENSELGQLLLETPSIVICDEAHNIKNSSSLRSKAAQQFKTLNRIAMTGSPLTNTVEDYYALINWVSPGYLADHAEFKQRFQDPIQKGLYVESDQYQKRKARKQLHILKALVEPKVHRKGIEVLRNELPKKMEFILTLSLTAIQMKAYNAYLQAVQSLRVDGISAQARIWSLVAALGRLIAHPHIFKVSLMKRKGANNGTTKKITKKSLKESSEVALPEHLLSDILATLADRRIEDYEQSNKVLVLLRILDEAKRAGEKVLVFSQNIDTLNYLVNIFQRQKRVYQHLDGSTAVNSRQDAVKTFNTDDSIEVYLISTMAGGVGLNMYGASRVVIFDFRFTPAEEQQAIGRAYRIGQTKPVFVYWLTTGGTFEDAILKMAVFKTQLASRIVDKKNPDPWSSRLREYFAPPRIPDTKDVSKARNLDPILDVLLQDYAKEEDPNAIIRSVTSTDTFEKEEVYEFTAEDKLEVEQDLKTERLRISNPEEYRRQEKERWMQLTKPSLQPDQLVSHEANALGSEPTSLASLGRIKVKLHVPPYMRASPVTPTFPSDTVPSTLPELRQRYEPTSSVAPGSDQAQGSSGNSLGNTLVSPDRLFGMKTPTSSQRGLQFHGIIQPQAQASAEGVVSTQPTSTANLGPMLGKHTHYKAAREAPKPVREGAARGTLEVGTKESHLLGSLANRTQQLRHTQFKPVLNPQEFVTAFNSALDAQNLKGLPRMDALQNVDKHIRENPRFADAVLSGHLSPGDLAAMERTKRETLSTGYTAMTEAHFAQTVWKAQVVPDQGTTINTNLSTIDTNLSTPKPDTKQGAKRIVGPANGNMIAPLKQEPRKVKTPQSTKRPSSIRAGDSAESPHIID